MAFLVSPGVQVKEIDLTNVVPSTSSTIGAMAGAFTWGPAEEIHTVLILLHQICHILVINI